MPVFNLSEINRVTLINIDGKEQECDAALARQWLDICPHDARDEAARIIGALCDAIRQIRNDYHYEFGRAERAVNQCVVLQMRLSALTGDGRDHQRSDAVDPAAPRRQEGPTRDKDELAAALRSLASPESKTTKETHVTEK